MAQEERFYERDLTYSAWHRAQSIGRFVGFQRAETLGMIDVDGVEYGEEGPLALIETARDVGQKHKATTQLVRLAERASLPAFLVLYLAANWMNPADARVTDILGFRVKRVWPDPERGWTIYTPEEWADFLVGLRRGG